MNDLILEIDKNAEGDVLACIGEEGGTGCYRIAGPKAWGGSTNLHSLRISPKNMVEFIHQCCPEIHAELKNKELWENN